MDGYNVLEDEQVWPSKYWPIVTIDGKSVHIDGKKHTWSLIRFAKDSQRAYNITRSRETEMYQLAPIAPIVATAKQIGVYADQWRFAHKKTFPYLLYTPDPEAPGAPQRLAPPQISSALANSAARDIDDMKATTGLFDASLGNRSNETSGVAIKARQLEGDVGTFPFIDNLGRGKLLTYKIILDLIPKIYDSQRIIQILGLDGTVTATPINTPGQSQNQDGTAVDQIVNDMTAGKYDLTMTMGPSYSTQRMEAADSLTRFVQAAPQTAVLIGDLIAKNQDWPGAQEVSRRLRTIVPPQALTAEEREEMAKDAPAPDPNAPPPPPDPRLIEMQMKMQIEAERLKMDMDMHELNRDKLSAEIENIRATGMKSIAQAEALEIGQQFEQYKLELSQLSQNIAHHVALTMEEMRQKRGMGAPGPGGGNGQGGPGEVDEEVDEEEGMPPGMGGGGPQDYQMTNPEGMQTPPAMGEQQNMPGELRIPGRAEGGPVNPNQPYLVGEEGPEVIVPNQAGIVIPNVGAWKPTTMPADQELQFQNDIKATPWYKEFVAKYNEEPNFNDPNYDYRGAWRAGMLPSERNSTDKMYHWSDRTSDGQWLKSPHHPTAWANPFMEKYGVNPDDLSPEDPRVIEYSKAWHKKYPPRY